MEFSWDISVLDHPSPEMGDLTGLFLLLLFYLHNQRSIVNIPTKLPCSHQKAQSIVPKVTQ